MITPNTNIRLLKVPFEIARKNQLTFASLTAQTNYFLSLPHLEYDNTTYQRQNNVIRFEAPIDDIRTYNYVMYKLFRQYLLTRTLSDMHHLHL